MPRKPNYSFERRQREQAKAAKQQAKREAKAGAKASSTDAVPDDARHEDGDDAADEADHRR